MSCDGGIVNQVMVVSLQKKGKEETCHVVLDVDELGVGG